MGEEGGHRMTTTNNLPFGPYTRELHQYLLRRLGKRRDVDDFSQEVWVRLVKVDSSEATENPLACLYGAASGVVSDFRSKNGSDISVSSEEAASEDLSDPATVSPDDRAIRLNLEQLLERALRQLPQTHQAVLLAHKRDGLTYEEVTVRLNLPVHTVQEHYRTAWRQIISTIWDR